MCDGRCHGLEVQRHSGALWSRSSKRTGQSPAGATPAGSLHREITDSQLSHIAPWGSWGSAPDLPVPAREGMEVHTSASHSCSTLTHTSPAPSLPHIRAYAIPDPDPHRALDWALLLPCPKPSPAPRQAPHGALLLPCPTPDPHPHQALYRALLLPHIKPCPTPGPTLSPAYWALPHARL